jgi:nitrate/TMAO reductase-like tetraheme cytochrome c subunit
MRRRKLTEMLDGLIEHIKGFVLALITIIAILGAVVGYKYYRHTQDDPEFCMSCHIMKEAYQEWQKGKHRDIVCQKCHHLTLLEQNHLLLSYVVKESNPFSQTHGRKEPWIECKKCHVNEVAQGSKTLRDSYGHAKHVFMLNIECKACHGKSLHLFEPDEKACLNCHLDKGVHGGGTEAFSCLKCHSYSEKTATMIPNERCTHCHKALQKGPMSNLKCYQCHKPHGKIKLTSKDCLGECHPSESRIGQHDLHRKKGVGCLDCHKAHTWVIGQKGAAGLCDRCHAMKDPKSFIY